MGSGGGRSFADELRTPGGTGSPKIEAGPLVIHSSPCSTATAMAMSTFDEAGSDSLLHEKCAVRDVVFGSLEEFLHDRMLAHVEGTWDRSRGPLVPQLPPFKTVIDELRPEVSTLVSSGGRE